MTEDVAVIDEVSDVRSTKIHPHFHARIRMSRIPVPVRDLNHVKELPFNVRFLLAAVDLEIVLRQHQEVYLVEVEFMVLSRPVLNCPVLDRALRGNYGWRIGRIKHGG